MKYDLPKWRMTLVDSDDEAQAFIAWVDGLDGLVSIDTETWSVTEMWGRDFPRLVTFSDDHEGWAIPVRWDGRLITRALATIRDKDLPVGMWNATFDMHALNNEGFPVPHWSNVLCGMTMHHMLVPHHGHKLKGSAGVELGRWALVGESWLKQVAKDLGYGKEWWAVPVDTKQYWIYGIVDTLLTQHMIRAIGPRMAKAGLTPAYDRKMACAAIMWRAEKRGIKIDHKLAETTRRKWLTRAVQLKDELNAAGIENPNSNKQIETLFKDLGWEPEEFTKTGQATLDKIALALLSETYPDIAPSIIEYKRLTKWVSTYLDPFVESKGRVHPGINTCRAKTGRMSITVPPLQTLPSKGSAGAIRACVLPEPGCHLWAIDYDGQEARIFANLSGDPGMAAAYAAGEDLYTHVARIVWADPDIQKSDPRRQTAKVILLAFSYGAGVDTLGVASGLPRVEVERFLRTLFTEFPTVRDMTGDYAIGGKYPGKPALLAAERLTTEGLAYVMTKGGRRFSMPPGEFYKAINGLCQGSGADTLDDAIIRLDRASLSDLIIVPVHDEVVFSIPKGQDEMAAEAAECMADHSWRIPLTVEVSGPFSNWGEAYV